MAEREHGAPKQITPKNLNDYLDVMSRSVFQSGMSWAIVEKKWPTTQQAFLGFDALKVASLTTKQIDALGEDTRVIRNRKKLDAVVHNARTMIELEEEHGSFKKYLRSHRDFDALVKDMRKRFKFMGEMGTYVFLYVVKEPVPEYEAWCSSRGVTPM